jgi:hypothetical protein
MQEGSPPRWCCRGGPSDGRVRTKRLAHIGHRPGQSYYRETDEVILINGMFYRVYEWIEEPTPQPGTRIPL